MLIQEYASNQAFTHKYSHVYKRIVFKKLCKTLSAGVPSQDLY